jgi:hypothetical protein
LEETEVKKGRGKRRGVTSIAASVAQEIRLGGLRQSVKGGRRTTANSNQSTLVINNNQSPRKADNILSSPKRSRRNDYSFNAVSDTDSLSSKSTVNLIECPEPNCNKKYKHINGLKYHQTHAHHQEINMRDKKEDSTLEDMNEESTSVTPEEQEPMTESVTQEEEEAKKPTSLASPAYSDISDCDDNDSQEAEQESAIKSKSNSLSCSSLFRPTDYSTFPYKESVETEQPNKTTQEKTLNNSSSYYPVIHSHSAFSAASQINPQNHQSIPLISPLWNGMSNGFPNDKQSGSPTIQKTTVKANQDSSGKDSGEREPPPQRHVHTHHHTHVGYPAVSVVPTVLPQLYDPNVYGGESLAVRSTKETR